MNMHIFQERRHLLHLRCQVAVVKVKGILHLELRCVVSHVPMISIMAVQKWHTNGKRNHNNDA